MGRDQASPGLVLALAFATGALVANLYYAQPLVVEIGQAVGLSPEAAGTVVGLTQIGYGLGLFFLVPLADVVENRRLVLVMASATAAALAAAAGAGSAAAFFAASLAIGLGSTAAQVLVPLATQLVAPERRGRVVGNVMAGLLAGIMLARPLSLFVAAALGWRAVFWGSAALMAALAVALARLLPRHAPPPGLSYARGIASMPRLLRDHPPVRWRALYQALMFCAFSLYWTAVPLLLAERFGLGGQGIGLFALAGAGGALAAPLAGRLADRGRVRGATAWAMATLAAAFAASVPAADAGSLAALAVLAVALDAAVQTNQVVGQRVIFSVPPEVRGRVNGIYMSISFAGAAVGSSLATFAHHRGGWTAAAAIGAALGAAALGALALESGSLRRRPTPVP